MLQEPCLLVLSSLRAIRTSGAMRLICSTALGTGVPGAHNPQPAVGAAGGYQRAASAARTTPCLCSLAAHGQQRRLLAAAAARGAPELDNTSSREQQTLVAGDEVEVAVAAACQALNRLPGAAEAALVQRLRQEWFDTAGAVAEMDDAEAAKLGVPLRLRSTLVELLRQQGRAHHSVDQVTEAEAPVVPGLRPGLSLPGPPQALDAGRPGRAGGSSAGIAHGDSSSGASSGSRGSSSSSSDGGSSLIVEPLTIIAATEAAALLADALTEDDGGLGVEEEQELQGEELAGSPSSGSTGGGPKDVHDVGAQLALPIEQRRCPPQSRFGFRTSEVQRVSKRRLSGPYALKESEMTEGLRQEFERMHAFLTQRFFGQIDEPIKPVTAAKYFDHLRGMLGYMHRQRGVPLEELSLRAALPSSTREGVTLVFDYIQWLHATRDISVRTEGLLVRAAAAAAKFLYHGETRADLRGGDKPYSDLEVIKELRQMSNACRKAGRVAARSSDESLKWLDWPQYLELVRELRRECAALNAHGSKRSRKAVAASLQKYLIFAIFACVPDRQRTLRELELGRTLVRQGERWVIKHGPGDYKTGKAYGERPPLVLAPDIYPELEAFMDTWRQELQPKDHNFLFVQELSGEPHSDKSLYKLFWTTAYRCTGKKVNPHLVRDSIVTYLRGSGASERELEALALYMGHSLEMQRSTYDRRTVAQKVEPAVELLESLKSRAREGLPSKQ